MASLVIPAHNEENVLARTLDEVLADLQPNEVEVVVACNGCTDRTAEIASRYQLVQVLDIAEASKVAALNAADEMVKTFPRIYLDADIDLSTDSLRLVIAQLNVPGALSAEPVPILDTTQSGLAVRAWYAVWQGLYGDKPGKIGSGVLGLSAAGRDRFAQFPKVVADDAYVRSLFGPDELVHVAGATSRVLAPRTLRDLIKIKTRSRLGVAELARLFPDGSADSENQPTTGSTLSGLRSLSKRLWPLAPWYFAVLLLVRVRAQYQARRGFAGWERDESSRSSTA